MAATRTRTVAIWVLIGIWTGLMSFAVVSLINPPWLQALSQPGREVEARDFKDHGDNMLRDGQYRLAATQYLRALQIRPDYGYAMSHLGITYRRLKDPVQSEYWLRKALTSPPVNAGIAHFHIADLEFEQARYADGHRSLRRALEAGYSPALVWRRAAEAYVAEERWDDARSAYAATLAAERDLTAPYRTMLYRDLPIERADSLAALIVPGTMERFDVTFLQYLQQTSPEISKTVNDLSIMHLRLGDTLRAMENMQEALKVWPRNETAQRNLTLLRQIWPAP